MEQESPTARCQQAPCNGEEISDSKAEVLRLLSGKLKAELERNNGENTHKEMQSPYICKNGSSNADDHTNLIPSNYISNGNRNLDSGNHNSSIASPSFASPNPNFPHRFPTHVNNNQRLNPKSNDLQRLSPAPFLSKTYQLVDDPATDKVVSWNDDGSTFVVWHPPEFAKDVLPNYFKHNNFSSFVRQLNTYGFRKIVPDKWEFAHDCFRKGKKYLLIDIYRRKTVVLLSKPSTSPLKQYTSPTDSASEQAASSSSSPLSSPPEKSAPLLADETERLKKENTLLVSELSCLRRLCSDLLLYIQRHVRGPSEYASPIASLLHSKGLSEDTSTYKSLLGSNNKRSRAKRDNAETKEADADCEFSSSKSGDDGGENLELKLVLPQARCDVSHSGTGAVKHIGDGGQRRSPPRLFGVALPCQKKISLGSSRHIEYQEKVSSMKNQQFL